MKELAEIKVNECYDFFTDIKRWRELSAEIRIAYHWRSYVNSETYQKILNDRQFAIEEEIRIKEEAERKKKKA